MMKFEKEREKKTKGNKFKTIRNKKSFKTLHFCKKFLEKIFSNKTFFLYFSIRKLIYNLFDDLEELKVLVLINILAISDDYDDDYK